VARGNLVLPTARTQNPSRREYWTLAREVRRGIWHALDEIFSTERRNLVVDSRLRSSGVRQPLILDQFVALALNRLVGSTLPTAQGGWTTAQYATYLDIAHKWAADWGSAPDVVERVLFSIGKASSLVVGARGRIHHRQHFSSAATTFAAYFGGLGVRGFTTRGVNAAFSALRA